MEAARNILPQPGPALTGPDRRTAETASAEVARAPSGVSQDAELLSKPEAAKAVDPEPKDSTSMSKDELAEVVHKESDSKLADSARKVVHTGVVTASILHGVTALGRIFPILPKSLQSFLENNALKVSKTVNALGYAIESAAAFAAKRGFDAVGRLMHVLFVPWVNIEDIFLTGGLSSGPTSMMLAVNRKEKPKSNWEDIKFHLTKVWSMTKQMFNIKSWFGKERLVFKGWPRPGKVEEQEPHTLLLGGWLNLFSPVLGLGTKFLNLPKTIYDKIRGFAAFTRNAGSPIADWGKFNHEKKVVRITGRLYILVAILDLAQSRIKNEYLKTTINHLLQVVTNFANYYYTRASAEMTEESKGKGTQKPEVLVDKTQFAFSV